MRHEPEGKNPLRVEMHRRDESIVVTGNVEDNDIAATGDPDLICISINIS